VVPHKCGINSGVPKGACLCRGHGRQVAGRRRGHARPADGHFDGPLDHGFVELVSPPVAGLAIRVSPGRGEDPLPGPFPPGIGIPHQPRCPAKMGQHGLHLFS